MAKRKIIDEVPYSMLKLIMRYLELDRKTQYYGTDKPIYYSEIHMISAIAQKPDINVKGLAEEFKITSASVSEMLTKLNKKGMVNKAVDKNHPVSLKLSLTEKGKRAHEEHMRYHSKLEQMVIEELSDASDEQIQTIVDFLNHMRNRLDEFEI
ncbi:MAG: MarR family transcriptional regulator [Clostridia bacterium]|nr:MarR family transcriptional regulator [Clostridia bacterium]